MKADLTQKKILGLLLDKYERSAFFKNSTKPIRKIAINLYINGRTDFPYYDIEQHEKRVEVNRAVITLQEAGILLFTWMKGEVGHIIEKVWLIYESIEEAYRLAERTPKSGLVDLLFDEINEANASVKMDWALSYLTNALDSITRRRSAPPDVPEDRTERANLIKSIMAIENMHETEVLERVFSLKTLGDSKCFEKTVKHKLIRILRKYTDNDDDTADDELLGQVGIVKYPEQFEFCGGLIVKTESATIDFSALATGGAVYSTDIMEAKLVTDSLVKKVLTIENHANYFDYIKKYKADDELVVYHGGQFSPRKRAFFHALKASLPPQALWRHWSDIDYGGFLMLLRLRQNIGRDIEPFRMDESELKHYCMFTVQIDGKYCEKLKTLTNHYELNDCLSCINYMVTNNIRLEQEAMLMM